MTEKTSHPIRWVPTAYFAMGLPFVVLNMVTTLMYKGLGVDDATITFATALILLPWTLKPLWSPLLEMYRSKRFFVIATQFVSGAAFGLAACCLHLPSYFALTIACFAIVAFSGATHDIACDGVYISSLNAQQQSAYIGWQGAFYNIAKIVASGGLVYIAGMLIESFKKQHPEGTTATNLAWTIVMAILGALMMVLAVYHIWALPRTTSSDVNKEQPHVWEELKRVLSDFFKKKHIAYYICFIICYRLAEGFAMKMVPLFLKAERSMGGLGLSEKEIGLYLGTFGAAAFVLGSICAGYYTSHFSLRRTLFSLCACFNIPFVVYAYFAVAQPTADWLICGGIVLEYFGYGFGFVGLMLFMMQQVSPGKHQMAHYAFASGIMNLGVMLPGMASGKLCEVLGNLTHMPGGYAPFFVLVLLTCIPAFILTYFIPFSFDEKGNRLTN